jgi:hypothetical protein
MPYVFGSSQYRSLDGYRPGGVDDTRRVNPQPTRKLVDIERNDVHRPSDDREKVPRAEGGEHDRRKVCQRFLRQRVLFDSRAGGDRRHRNQRESDIVEHISETA